MKLAVALAMCFLLLGCSQRQLKNATKRDFWVNADDSLDFGPNGFLQLGRDSEFMTDSIAFYSFQFNVLGEKYQGYLGKSHGQLFRAFNQFDEPYLWFDFDLFVGDSVSGSSKMNMTILDKVIDSTYFYRPIRATGAHNAKPVRIWALDVENGFNGCAEIQVDSCGVPSLGRTIFPENFGFIKELPYGRQLGGFVGFSAFSSHRSFGFRRSSLELTCLNLQTMETKTLNLSKQIKNTEFLKSCLYQEQDSLVLEFEKLSLKCDLDLTGCVEVVKSWKN